MVISFFPYRFKALGLGKLIGKRTWGGVVGIRESLPLADDGQFFKPEFAIYARDGKDWILEGHGVDPDIEVPEDLTALAKGTDPQLERAIVEIKNLIKTKGYLPPKLPAYEKR